MHKTQYTLVSSQPLSAFGRSITAQQIAFFAERRLWSLVDEFASLKSDGVADRDLRNQELASGLPGYVLSDATAAPLSLHIMRCWLSQLGLHVNFNRHENHVELELSRLTSDMVRQISKGVITKSDTIDYRGRQPVKGGLLCPTIYHDHQAELFNWAYVELGASVFSDMWVQLPGQTDPEQCQCPWDVMPIVPLAFRPLVELDTGQFATHDINDLYRQLVNRSNRGRKLKELNAPAEIIENEQMALQSELLHAQANRYFAKRQARLSNGKRLLSAADMVLDYLMEPYEKRVEWCAAAPGMVSCDRDANQVVVTAELFDRLLLSPQMPVLMCAPKSARWCSAMPVRGADTLAVSSALANQLGIADEMEIEIHRPITAAGQNEALALLKMGPAADPPASSLATAIEVDGWVEDDGERKLFQRLLALARDGGSISLRSGTGYLIAGTGRSVEFP